MLNFLISSSFCFLEKFEIAKTRSRFGSVLPDITHQFSFVCKIHNHSLCFLLLLKEIICLHRTKTQKPPPVSQ